MSQMDEFSIEINEKIDVDNDKPHSGKAITRIEVSPNEKYLVTYSEEDKSIVGWCVDEVNKDQFKLNNSNNTFEIPMPDNNITIKQICVSDDMKLAYIYESSGSQIKLYDMKNNGQEIRLDCDLGEYEYEYCIFNSKDEFILNNNRDNDCRSSQNIIIIYSTKTKNDKWWCKRMYKIPTEFQLIISKKDDLYLYANNSIYAWSFLTKKSIKIFGSDEMKYYDMSDLRKELKIFRDEKFIYTRIKDEIIIYSIELETSIACLDINDGIQLYNYMKRIGSDLSSLLPLLSTTKYTFQIQDGYTVEAKNTVESDEINKEAYKSYEHLIHLFNPYKETIRNLFQKVKSNFDYNDKELELKSNFDYKELERNSIKWEIRSHGRKIKLQVFNINNDINNRWDLINSWDEDFNIPMHRKIFLLGIESLDDNDIILITSIGLFIYHLNSDNSISLNYFYYMDSFTREKNKKFLQIKDQELIIVQNKIRNYEKEIQDYIKLKATLPSPNHDSFKISNEWVSYVKDNKESLLKYGVELLTFAIKEQQSELVDHIYKKCINYFKEDFRNNWMFLSIITSTMPHLNEYFPDYISRYSLETTMIIDCPTYNIDYKHNRPHLHSSQYPQIIDITKSILWLKYNLMMAKLENNYSKMFSVIQLLIILLILPILPIYLVTFYILSKYDFINDIYANSIYYKVVDFLSKKLLRDKTTPTIIFMIPYIKFVNYPKDYDWFQELIFPKPSPFINTINRDIYRTLNGEALINFKWNTYGKYYHGIIWIAYATILGCFNAAAVGIPQRYISANIRDRFLIVSIIFGFIRLSFEVRRFIYNPAKWIRSVGNFLSSCVYVLTTYTSILWLTTNDNDQIIPYLTLSCLLLNLKLISFFRIFEIYEEYYTIVIRIAKRVVIFFLCFIMVILASFSFAFYILLSPKKNYSLNEPTINDDPNNPWNLATKYQAFDNGPSNSSDLFILQTPDGNTNRFANYANSFFATCLLLTGDTSSLSNWTYADNPILMILMVSFTFATTIYILNVFITLFSEAVTDSDDSYLITKAEYLAEIELFYLLPHQRRWNSWFPEVIHYHASIKKTRKEIKYMIKDKEWKTKEFPKLKRTLTEKLGIYDYVVENTLQEISTVSHINNNDNVKQLKHEYS